MQYIRLSVRIVRIIDILLRHRGVPDRAPQRFGEIAHAVAIFLIFLTILNTCGGQLQARSRRVCENGDRFGLTQVPDRRRLVMNKLTSIAALLLAASTAQAHHGTAGQFDHSKSLQVSGTVTRIRFVNPHSYVYFDVVGDDGETQNWRCEMRAATLLKRSGWTAEMFAPGTRIKIDGVPARREPYGCYVETIAFDDGKVVERYEQLESADAGVENRNPRRPDGTPNLEGTWAAAQRLPNQAEVRRRAAGGPNGGPPRGSSRYQQTEAGQAASAGWQREDNPRFHCMAVNIFADWTFDQHINQIEQSDETIRLTYGFMDIVREIHLDQDEHPANITPSRAGHSIGQWEGDTLVVDTVGFLEGVLDSRNGVKHSTELHVVERFSLSEDGKSLNRSWVGNDPLYLSAPFEGRDVIGLSAAAFDPYNCEDLTEEVVDGF